MLGGAELADSLQREGPEQPLLNTLLEQRI